ncbi:MAG: hypothetical protein ACR2H7_03425 [Actinomycetota bacterium]
MDPQRRRRYETMAEPDYVDDLGSRSLEDLRAARDECREVENELSFERRLCHARIDILRAEVERRSGSQDQDLLSRLPEILGSAELGPGAGTSLPSRAPDLSIPRNADVPRRRVEEIAGEQTMTRLNQLGADEVKETMANLAEHERELSARRSRIHEVMDVIQAEIVRRYTSGEADPSSALG